MTQPDPTAPRIRLSEGARYLHEHPSAIRQGWVLTRAKCRGGAKPPFEVINHDVGRIPLEPPAGLRPIMQAALDRWDSRSYVVPATGPADLREALSAEINALGNSTLTTPNNVAIVAGGSLGAVTFWIGMGTNHGDEWWEAVPAWGGTKKEVTFWGRKYRTYAMPTGHLPEVDDLLEAIPEHAAVFSINDPGNPTGYSLTEHDCEVLRDFAIARPDTIVMVDSTYMRLNAVAFVSPFLYGIPNIVIISGGSKGVNLADARIGWTMWSHKAQADAYMQDRCDQLLSPPNTADVLHAIAANLADNGTEDCIPGYCRRVLRHVEGSRDTMAGRLKGHPLLRHRRGTSAIYCCIEEVDETVDPRAIWRWGVQQRYEGKINRPLCDMVAAFTMESRWMRFTHAKKNPLPGLEAWIADREEYEALGRPKDLPMAELIKRYGPPPNGNVGGAVE